MQVKSDILEIKIEETLEAKVCLGDKANGDQSKDSEVPCCPWANYSNLFDQKRGAKVGLPARTLFFADAIVHCPILLE